MEGNKQSKLYLSWTLFLGKQEWRDEYLTWDDSIFLVGYYWTLHFLRRLDFVEKKSFEEVRVFCRTKQCTDKGSEKQKEIAQSASKEWNFPLAGRNNRERQNFLGETKKTQTQEDVTDESRSPMEMYKTNTYETIQRLLWLLLLIFSMLSMLMLLLQMLILIDFLMFNYRTLSYLNLVEFLLIQLAIMVLVYYYNHLAQ
jgi:hypothetical protein